MRILFFSTAFPQPDEPSRNPDNLERCVALARRHDVHVMSPLSWLRLGAPHEAIDSSVLRGLTVTRPLFCYPPGVLRSSHAWCMWHGIRRAASRSVATFRPDAVLSYWTYPDTAVAMNVAGLAGVPCVAIVGGSDVLSIDPDAPGATGRRVQRVLRAAGAIAAVSDSIKDRIVALGVAAEQIGVLPAAVDKTIFFPASKTDARRQLGIAPNARVLVWVGRMVGVKRIDVLLDAMARLITEQPDVRLYLIGDGPLRAGFESRVAASDLSNHVLFTGRVAHRDLPAYYRAADVTLLPSDWEGMPNTLLESHACGTPFVASGVGAIPQLAIAQVDEVVHPGDARQLADAIATCLRRDGANAAVMSAAGGWDEMADMLADLLERARRARRISGAADESMREGPRTHQRPSLRRSWRVS